MRDVLAIASVIVVAVGLGGVAAYLSVDFTPPGLDLIRPPAPAVAERIERQEKQATIQAEASECTYCSSVADLAKNFSRRAEAARRHATALEDALSNSDRSEITARRDEELKSARTAATNAEEAAAVLTGWASRCKAEDFCKVSPVKVAAAKCVGADDARVGTALLTALTVQKAAQSCATASCPSVDCRATGTLRSDMARVVHALDGMGGRMSIAAGQTSPAQLPVGASTFKAELSRIDDEASYVTKMLPLLLDNTKGKAGSGQLPKLASEMIDERAVSAAQLATVMEQAATVSDLKADPREEAAWRLKSLSANLAALGKDMGAQAAPTLKWAKVADTVGATLADLARLQAMVDRVSKDRQAAAGCDGAVATAVQKLREASAMLDLCRMRSACVGRGGSGSVVQASQGKIDVIMERANAAAQALVVNEIESGNVIPVATAEQEPQPIELLRSQGVCRRAGELREATTIAPVVTQAVAETAVPEALTPATGGAIAPQDLVVDAVAAAVEAPGAVNPTGGAEGLVDAATQFSNASPRFKPNGMGAEDADLLQAAAPQPPAASPSPSFSSGGLGFGGEGGPVQAAPPPASAPVTSLAPKQR
jgi:hypothetical protein